MTEPTVEQQEEWRQAELAKQERARRQAILDYWMELKLNREAEERAYGGASCAKLWIRTIT